LSIKKAPPVPGRAWRRRAVGSGCSRSSLHNRERGLAVGTGFLARAIDLELLLALGVGAVCEPRDSPAAQPVGPSRLIDVDRCVDRFPHRLVRAPVPFGLVSADAREAKVAAHPVTRQGRECSLALVRNLVSGHSLAASLRGFELGAAKVAVTRAVGMDSDAPFASRAVDVAVLAVRGTSCLDVALRNRYLGLECLGLARFGADQVFSQLGHLSVHGAQAAHCGLFARRLLAALTLGMVSVVMSLVLYPR